MRIRITRFWRYAALNMVLPVGLGWERAIVGLACLRCCSWHSRRAPLRRLPRSACCARCAQVALLGLLGLLVVFFIDRRELATRLGGRRFRRRQADS